MKTAYVYILANRWRTLYVGVTTNLEKRLFEHREGVYPGFTSKYQVTRLVHVESCHDVREAINREKQIKAWRRSKKVALIENFNPKWEDLAADLFLK